MFNKILIAVDDSACSERAGRVGLQLAQKLHLPVLIGHVLKSPPSYMGLTVPSETMQRFAQDLLHPWEVLGREMQLELDSEYLDDPNIAEGIVFLANRSGCDLIIMGTHGREGIGRLLLGSVAERVSRLAKMPLLLVRGDGAVDPSTGVFERILAPIDGSLAGHPAFELADRLAQQLDAELDLLYVIPPIPAPMVEPWGTSAMINYDWEPTLKAMQDEGQAVLEGAQKQAKAPRVKATLIPCEHRHQAQAIVAYAHQHHADLIVMGTHGRTGLDRLLLGSVSEGVAHHAGVPLLLVRPTPTAASPEPSQRSVVSV